MPMPSENTAMSSAPSAISPCLLIECEPTDRVELDGDAPAVLAFTSGTAGSPKPAILSHAALSVNIEQQKASAEDRVRADDVTLGVAPLSHIMGLNSVLSSSLSVGASTLLIERFDPVLALESMQKHGVTVAVGPPTMWSSWLNLPDLPADVFASVRIAADRDVIAFQVSGDRVAFTADPVRWTQYELFSVPISGGSPVKLSGSMPSDNDVDDFAFADDGWRVVYRKGRNATGVWDLWSTGVTGGGTVRLSQSNMSAVQRGFQVREVKDRKSTRLNSSH